jgi:FKBP-type peptidyl-prolyl cis-trans isomerase
VNKFRITVLTLVAFVGVVGFYIIHKKEIESPIKTQHAASSSFTNQKETLSNQTSEEFVTTLSGLQYRILNEGSGDDSPGPESLVSVHYRGKLTNGLEFDSSYKRNQPASFPVNGVIRGWTEALQLMKEGDKWELIIPPDLGYGSKGAGNIIPPDSTLIIEVELIEIK